MSYYNYWGKASDDTHHLLIYHMLDVGAVAFEYLNASTKISQALTNDTTIEDLQNILVFLTICHDVGKFHPAFQSYRPDIFNGVELQGDKRYHHTETGIAVLLEFLRDHNVSRPSNIVTPFICHHGLPQESHGITPETNNETFYHDSIKFLTDIAVMLDVDLSTLDKNYFTKYGFVINGFVIFCDWVGSNERYFPYVNKHIPLDVYFNQAKQQASIALNDMNLTERVTIPFNSVMDTVGFDTPTPLQQWASECDISTDRLYIMEDITGSGKTEAAIILAHRLLTYHNLSGYYFALPTNATSNAIFERLASINPNLMESPTYELVTGKRKLNGTRSAIVEGRESDNQINELTLIHPKASFTNAAGVGTIDTALLGILPVKHSTLRLFGLFNKVLIIDEIHTYDSYTGKLVNELVDEHLRTGGFVIVMTATLTLEYRQTLSKSDNNNPVYPSVTTGIETNCITTPIVSRSGSKRFVAVEFLHTIEHAIQQMITDAVNDKSTCYICNTVAEALEVYQMVISQYTPDNVTLFHSKFTTGERAIIETDLKHNFGPNSKPSMRQGRIVIATQVIEQSMDLDFDTMYTSLAPIDSIIQRAGRLQRHDRGVRQPVLFITAPVMVGRSTVTATWYSSLFARASFVYSNVFALYKTMEVLQQTGGFDTVDDIRMMMEYVYSDIDIPEVFEENRDKNYGANCADKNLANLNIVHGDQGYNTTSATSWDGNVTTRININSREVFLSLNGDPIHKKWENSVVSVANRYIECNTNGLEITGYLWDDAEVIKFTHYENGVYSGGSVIDEKGTQRSVQYTELGLIIG